MTECKFCKKYVNLIDGAFFHKGKPCHLECGQKFLKEESK